jgi:hypothetical protein
MENMNQFDKVNELAWEQPLIGIWKKGNLERKLAEVRPNYWLLTSEDDYWAAEFDTKEDLNAYLKSESMPLLREVPRSPVLNNWVEMNSISDNTSVFSKKISDLHISTLQVIKFGVEDYSVMLWDVEYLEDEYLHGCVVVFVEEESRDPISDIELCSLEAQDHGSSGMDATHHNLKDLGEVKRILRDIYKFTEEELKLVHDK